MNLAGSSMLRELGKKLWRSPTTSHLHVEWNANSNRFSGRNCGLTIALNFKFSTSQKWLNRRRTFFGTDAIFVFLPVMQAVVEIVVFFPSQPVCFWHISQCQWPWNLWVFLLISVLWTRWRTVDMLSDELFVKWLDVIFAKCRPRSFWTLLLQMWWMNTPLLGSINGPCSNFWSNSPSCPFCLESTRW